MSESDKKRHWNAITTILVTFIACSELSLKICRQCCHCNLVSDLLEYVVKYQKDYHKDKSLSTLTAKSLIILHNCSKAAENKQVYRQLGASEKIAPFLKSKNDDMAATSLFTLSYIIERSKQHLLKAENRVLIYILGIFDACLDDYSQERKGFSTSEIVVGLGNIAINDENKLSLVNNGLVPRLLRMMKRDSPVEQECAINTFTTLTKLKSTRNLIVDKYDAVQILSKHTDSDVEAVRHAAERAMAPIKNTPPRSAAQRKVSTSTSVSSASLNCNYRQLCLRFKKSLDLSDAYFAAEYDMCYCNSCHIERGDELYYSRGLPPKDYGLPIGWCRFAIQVPARVAPLNVFHKWHVAFHGTRPDAVRPILECGDLLMPGDLEMEGRKLAERDGHFNEKSKPVGFDTKQIFLSPSIRYSGSNAYAYPSKFKDDIAKKVYWSKVAFQVWIKPESYNIGPQTIGAKYEIDPRFNNQELEWFTKRRGCIVVSGLLVNLQETY
ncbi:uncharacterized protein [Ptychodera flava]|uniref:uncharacterized protein n=1 Tax=Ptychodera flava TaxID=63121 RepID=UPI00396A81BF